MAANTPGIEVKIIVTGMAIFMGRGVLREASKAPKKLPRKKVTVIDTSNSHSVQGKARLTIASTVVGKKAIE